MNQFEITLNFYLNHQPYQMTTSSDKTIADILLKEFQLKGVRYGCGGDKCRACTILIDNKPQLACLLPATEMQGKQIITIEGIEPHPLQQSFIYHGAITCGYCTPGMILEAYRLIKENPTPTMSEIKRALKGHICYCKGYQNIWKAIYHWQDFIGVDDIEKLPRWVTRTRLP